MIRMRGERERRRRESGEGIAKNGERLTALQAIGEVARGKLCEAGESVGNAFDGAKPRGTRTDGGEKRWEHGGWGFMAPVAEQACEAGGENGAGEPGLVGLGILAGWDGEGFGLSLG